MAEERGAAMADKKIDVRFGEEVAGRTIVGGRNHGSSSGTVAIPVGIEKVLYLAATDRPFKALLLSRPEETLKDPRLRLDDAERELLRAVPAGQLQTMIERIDPKAHGGRRFIRSVAACTAVLASSTALLGCDPDGNNTDRVDAQVAFPDSGGVRPDRDASLDAQVETVDAEVPQAWDAGGVRPDDSGV
jgi:hypothetical protein